MSATGCGNPSDHDLVYDEKSGNPRSHAIRYTQGTPTEYKSKQLETKRKAKAHKMLKKRKEDVAEDVAEVTWFLRM